MRRFGLVQASEHVTSVLSPSAAPLMISERIGPFYLTAARGHLQLVTLGVRQFDLNCFVRLSQPLPALRPQEIISQLEGMDISKTVHQMSIVDFSEIFINS